MQTRSNKQQVMLRAFPLQDIQVRAGEGDDGPVIEGYAAVFDVVSEDLGGFREIIRPGAFSKTLSEADVRATFNHNPDYTLGRNKAGTLAMAEDARGLRVSISPPDTQWARDLMVSMERGDVDQMSFMFRSIKSDWLDPDPEGGRDYYLWEQQEVRLFDVSIVTFPAYTATEAAVRSLGVELYTPEPPQERHSDDDRSDGTQERPSITMLRKRLELLDLGYRSES